jgi:colicin import membrane protein
MSNLVLIDPKEYNLAPETANELLSNLPSILEERVFLFEEYELAAKLDPEHPESADVAKELRLRIRDNRTKGIEAWHKRNKEVFLRGGQFVDAIKRKYAEENKEKEDVLAAIEKHKEIQEQKAKEERKAQRMEQIKEYTQGAEPAGIAEMDDVTFSIFAKGLKERYEQQQAEAKAAAEEQERIRKENEKLRKEKEELEAKVAKEEAEKRKKEEAERKAQQEAEEAKRKAEAAPDMEKLKAFVQAIADLPMPSVTSEDAENLVFEFEAKRQGFVNWMNAQIK